MFHADKISILAVFIILILFAVLCGRFSWSGYLSQDNIGDVPMITMKLVEYG